MCLCSARFEPVLRAWLKVVIRSIPALCQARAQLLTSFDPVHGGFGAAPKFPHPTHIECLLRQWAHSTASDQLDQEARTAACFTLRKMASGGIYDHLEGGFCRYAVDDRWMIPHFEKMLYDNGPLLGLYSQAWRATGEPLFKTVAQETGAWVIRHMQAPAGGYYATLDADSEGEEGKFYLWTPAAARQSLSAEEYAVFAARFGLEGEANCEDRWHLYVCADMETVARRAGVSLEEAGHRLDAARHKLLQVRSQRVWPSKDKKILCAWNGLMIKGMAIAARYLDQAEFSHSAERALDFIRENLWCDGRLLAVYAEGRAHLPAYLDDYALLLDGIVELLQVRWRDGDLDFAVALADTLLQHFQDPKKGGFFFTADDHEALIDRPKPVYDDALPAGNGIAAQALFKLGHLLGSMPYLIAAERTLKWAWPRVEQAPIACGALLLAVEEYFQPSQIIILRGQPEALEPWRRRCARSYAPARVTLAIPATAGPLPGLLAQREPRGQPVAYVCSGQQCSAPIVTLEALEELLTATEVPVPAALRDQDSR